jgi:hypothetical protein
MAQKFVICSKETLKPVAKNSKTAGKPRLKPINGQKFYNGEYTHWERIKIKDQLREYAKPYLTQRYDGVFPIRLEFHFHTTTRQDINNHAYVYEKMLTDIMVEEGVIPGDDPRYITGYSIDMTQTRDETETRIDITFVPAGTAGVGQTTEIPYQGSTPIVAPVAPF